MDEDLTGKTKEKLIEEVRLLRNGIREHRDSTGKDLCWHHPKLWGLHPEKTEPSILVPPWNEFLQGRIKYRLSLDQGEFMTDVKKIPEGYHTVTPYMVIKDAKRALDFYQRAFNAKILFQMPDPKGLVMHAEMQVGDSKIMLCDEMPGWDSKSPESYGGTPMSLMLYVEDVDKLFKQASEAGAHVVRPVTNQFYGDRAGTLKDPFGHIWTLSTHVEDVPMDEMKKRMQKMQASSSSQTSTP